MTDFTEQTHIDCIYVFWSLLFEGIPWACAHTARQLLIKSIQDNEVQLEAVAELMLCCKHCFPSLWAHASLEPVSLGATIPTATICRSDHWAPEAADAFSHSNGAPLSIYPHLPLWARGEQTLFTPQPPLTPHLLFRSVLLSMLPSVSRLHFFFPFCLLMWHLMLVFIFRAGVFVLQTFFYVVSTFENLFLN